MSNPDLTRRALGGAALLGVAAPVLAACGGDEPTTSGGSGSSSTPPQSDASSPSKDAGGGGGGGTAAGLVAASEVPAGGGVILQEEELVVTQPSEGTFKGFSAICTHQGCVVSAVSDGQINCGCHGSAFSVEDGSVVNGPASTPLEEVPLKVQGGQVTRG